MSILQMSFSASVMILAVVLIRSLTLHRLPKRTFLALWAAALCRLLIPFSVPSRFSFYTGLAWVKQSMLPETNASPSLPPVVTGGAVAVPVPPAVDATEGIVTAARAMGSISPVFAVWLAGVCGCALFFLIAYLKCRREFRASLPVQNDFAARWLQAHPLRRSVRLRQTDRIQAPLTYGVLRPVILFPKTTDWTDEAGLRVILTHEHTHIRRFDTLTKLALTAAVCVHWFNPLVWAMYGLANRDIELACDEAAVRSLGQGMKSAYAMTLIRLEEKRSGLAPLISGFGKTAIEERITAVMKMTKTSLIGILLALALVAGTVTVFATNAAEKPAPLSASAALEQLAGSLRYTDGELSFQVPDGYPRPEDWSLWISGRMEQDGFGMSVHYLAEESESKRWQVGKRYAIPLAADVERYTELWLDASLPAEDGTTSELRIDLLEAISSGPSGSGSADSDAQPWTSVPQKSSWPTRDMTFDRITFGSDRSLIVYRMGREPDSQDTLADGTSTLAYHEAPVKYTPPGGGDATDLAGSAIDVTFYLNALNQVYRIDVYGDCEMTGREDSDGTLSGVLTQYGGPNAVERNGDRYILWYYSPEDANQRMWFEVEDGALTKRMGIVLAAGDSAENTPPDAETAAQASLTWPVEGGGRVSSPYGERLHPVTGKTTSHDHIDIAAEKGSKVLAALDGTVLDTGANAEDGRYIVLSHTGGLETAYRHLDGVQAASGDHVTAGDVIGTVGATGKATGPFLAFRVSLNGAAVNPLDYLTVPQ